MQEPELKQVDISAFKPEPFNIIKFCQTWLPRVFVGIMLLGVIWLFKAGVDAGLLTPAIRIVFGIALSIGLYYIGDIQIKKRAASVRISISWRKYYRDCSNDVCSTLFIWIYSGKCRVSL